MSLVVCFGETLWDILPGGRYLGGAPLNAAFHLAQLGRNVRLVSAVGNDVLGDEAIAGIRSAGIDARAVRRHAHLPTGVATVELDEAGQPTYSLAEPVAWDEIPADPIVDLVDPLHNGQPADAFVFGTLALRSEINWRRLHDLLSVPLPLTVCDLNLRSPYDDMTRIGPLLRRVQLLKVNASEARLLAGGSASQETPRALCERICAIYQCESVCITLGSQGAGILVRGEWHEAAAPLCVVRDTIGAGDAFTAALVDGILSVNTSRDWSAILHRACALGSFVASRDGAQPQHDAFARPA